VHAGVGRDPRPVGRLDRLEAGPGRRHVLGGGLVVGARRPVARGEEAEQRVRVRVVEQPLRAHLAHERLPAERRAADHRPQRRLHGRPPLDEVGGRVLGVAPFVEAYDERAGHVERGHRRAEVRGGHRPESGSARRDVRRRGARVTAVV
jgi:hypothetical protein